MKFVKIAENYNITREKVTAAISVVAIISTCVVSCCGVVVAMNSGYDYTVQTTNTTATSEETEESILVTATESTAEETTTTETFETTEATETSLTQESLDATESSAETSATTKETKPAITEKKLQLRVYATTSINVRKGPGKSYSIVKNLKPGDEIDVVAKTSNGWYKTYNGNYVSIEFTTTKKPTSTPTPTKKPTATPKKKNTPTPTPKKKATATPKPTSKPTSAPSKDGMTYVGSFTVTFYGPTTKYGYSTASGAKATEGRTVSTNWSVLPKGTKIYIENDPLPGHNGYYVVEDNGVGPNTIDIFAELGESGKYPYTTRRGLKVYIVN